MRFTQMLLRRGYQFKYFQRYIDRELTAKSLQRKWHPLTGWFETKRTDWVYNEHRPWTEDFKRANPAGGKHDKIYVEPVKEWKIFKGDRVEILVGKDQGKQGVINSIIVERNWCFVEGLNCEFKVLEQHGAEAVCIKSELPLLITSQVQLIDPSNNQATDVEWRFTEEGKKVRVSVETGRIIPLPLQFLESEDFVLPETYVECEKDTKEKELVEITFEPKLMTFEQEIMDSLGIKEDRKPAKTYWY